MSPKSYDRILAMVEELLTSPAEYYQKQIYSLQCSDITSGMPCINCMMDQSEAFHRSRLCQNTSSTAHTSS